MNSGLGKYLSALAMILSAVALALPIPPIIPLTNTLPALAITLFCLGFLMRDGVMTILGHLMHITSWGYFVSVASVAFSFATKIVEFFK